MQPLFVSKHDRFVRAFAKWGVVAAGYLAAFAIASVAVAIRVANTSGPDAQASGGMYAFGDSLLFVEVFGILSIAPTAFALFLLRGARGLWRALSVAELAYGIVSFVALVVYLSARLSQGTAIMAWAAFAVLVLLVAPFLVPPFLFSAILARDRSSRVMLFIATAAQASAGIFALGYFYSRMLFG